MTESSSVNGMFELEAMEYERETKIFMRGRREIKLPVIYSGPAEQTLNQGLLLIVRCGVSLAAGGCWARREHLGVVRRSGNSFLRA